MILGRSEGSGNSDDRLKNAAQCGKNIQLDVEVCYSSTDFPLNL